MGEHVCLLCNRSYLLARTLGYHLVIQHGWGEGSPWVVAGVQPPCEFGGEAEAEMIRTVLRVPTMKGA